MKDSAKHIDLLDCVRGVAILSVLFYHTLGSVFGRWSLPWDGWMRDFPTDSFLYFLPFSFGQLGVAIFFVVSGFCIHLSCRQQNQRWSSFFIRRFFRIYPAYFVALIFSAIFLATHSPENFHSWLVWKEWLTHIFLIHNLFPDTIIGFNGVFWSLAVEVQLYLLYPVLLFLVGKFGWRRTMMILGSCEFLIRATDGVLQTAGATNAASTLLSASPLGYWFSWSLGAFIADAFLKNQLQCFSEMTVMPWMFAVGISYFFRPTFPLMFPLAAIATAIIISRFLPMPRPAIRVPEFSLMALKKIGLWSYSIYLLHEPLFRYYAFAFDWYIPEQHCTGPLVFFLVMLCWLPVIVFSILWYKVFELPGIAIGKRVIQNVDARNAAMFEPQRTQEAKRIGKLTFCSLLLATLFFCIGNVFIGLKLTHPDSTEDNNLAWSLATDPNPAKRNGSEAVKLAQLACRLTDAKEPRTFGTLAAAYAEVGRFDDAILSAQKAIALATEKGDEKLADRNRELLSFYLNRQPYREEPTNSSVK